MIAVCLIFLCGCENFRNEGKLEYPPILFLSSKNMYEKFMMRDFFNVANAYISVSKKSVIWGIGFEGYNTNLSLKTNVINQFGSVEYFTALMVAQQHVINSVRNDFETKEISKDIIVMMHNHEWDYRDPEVIDRLGVKILSLTYGQEVAELAYDDKVNVDMIFHRPHTAPVFMYAPVNDEKRTGGALLIGNIYEAYPMRQRWRDLIEAGKISGGSIYKHPGYVGKGMNDQHDLYIDSLQKHKVVLFCSCKNKYQLSKYVESAMAGSLIIATLSNEDTAFWAENIVQVDMNMSDDELIEIVKYWLDHDTERIAKAEKAQKAVLSKYTMNDTARQIAESIALYQSGFRGTKHDYPFVNTCASMGATFNPNKWCKKRKDSVFFKKPLDIVNKERRTHFVIVILVLLALVVIIFFLKHPRKN